MAEIAPLIRSAVRSARDLNRMLVAELRAQRALGRHYEARPGDSMSRADLRAWHHHDDAIWQLQNGRDDCMQFARGLRCLVSHLGTAA